MSDKDELRRAYDIGFESLPVQTTTSDEWHEAGLAEVARRAWDEGAEAVRSIHPHLLEHLTPVNPYLPPVTKSIAECLSAYPGWRECLVDGQWKPCYAPSCSNPQRPAPALNGEKP